MIYVSSACLQRKYISEIIKDLAKQGIQNIELSGGTMSYPEIEHDLINLKKQYSLKYAFHAYFPPPSKDFVVNLASCNDEIYSRSIEQYMSCIEMMGQVECKTLSIHAGFYVEITPDKIGKELSKDIIYDKKQALERFCYAYEKINNRCKQSGISLYLENNVLNKQNYEKFENRNLLMMTNYETYCQLKKKLDFNLLLDLGHLHVSTNTLGLSFEEECQKFANHTKWLHISQNNGILDEHKPLVKQSEIMQCYEKYFDHNINVTLETVGNIEKIKSSIQIL